MTIQNINTNEFNKLLNSNCLFLADFSNPYCAPCKRMHNTLENIEKKYKNKINIAKINTSEENELAIEYGIFSVPTVIFFKNGEEIDRIIGAVNPKQLEKTINNHLQSIREEKNF